MPIKREQFDQGIDDMQAKVLDFLKSRRSEAFTASEVADGLGLIPRPPGQGIDWGSAIFALGRMLSVDEGLSSLAAKGLIEAKTIKGHRYYSSKS